MPFYIVGTEVPPPGGADHALDAIEPTAPAAARQTLAIHREIFAKAQLSDAFQRVIGIVVQPGVEFGNHNVITYQRDKADALVRILNDEPGLVFEAHSTDYQGEPSLTELVEDGFAILKVGPELTFVLREALYALDLIASDLLLDYGDRPLFNAMEAVMVDRPENWKQHYDGNEAEKRVLRHYSLSDRIRYYWTAPDARAAVERLTAALAGKRVPLPLLWQHLPGADQFADVPLDPQELLIWRIGKSLSTYHRACRV
jgi:D-tagatose-1,6-bisphosphate aldolase subunit GatZ/KbaZ